MKILYLVINGEISGGNIVCLNIIEEALKRKHDVVVNSPTEGKFTSILRQKGIKVYSLNTSRTFRLDSALRLACLVKKEGVNLIHSHTPLCGIILSRLGGWISGVPVINHAHTPDFINLNPIIGSFQHLLVWLTSRLFCARIIAVSEFVKREIIKQGNPEDKIIVIYNGVNGGNVFSCDIYGKIRDEFGLRPGQHIIAEVARLCNDKGQHILIQAAASVIGKFPDVSFMLVGEDLASGGEYKIELEKLAVDLGLREKVIFAGYRSDITDLMRAFDLVVLPTVFLEGLALVILEAMSAKKAVIATSVGGNPEIVSDGETGTLVHPEDPGKLAGAIIYHLSNPEISRQMGEKGYKRASNLFSLSRMLERVMDVYAEVLRKS